MVWHEGFRLLLMHLVTDHVQVQFHGMTLGKFILNTLLLSPSSIHWEVNGKNCDITGPVYRSFAFIYCQFKGLEKEMSTPMSHKWDIGQTLHLFKLVFKHF